VDHDYITTMDKLESLTDFKDSVVEYIGGFVVRQVRKNLKCDICSCSLVSDNIAVPLKLTDTKNRGGLVRLSSHVKKVCAVTEQCLQLVKKTEGLSRTQGNLIQALCSTVLKVVAEQHSFCFNDLDHHDMDCTTLKNHKHVLIKSIALSYLKIRLHHEARIHADKIQVFIHLKIVLKALLALTLLA
jgi:hypothetical protein